MNKKTKRRIRKLEWRIADLQRRIDSLDRRVPHDVYPETSVGGWSATTNLVPNSPKAPHVFRPTSIKYDKKPVGEYLDIMRRAAITGGARKLEPVVHAFLWVRHKGDSGKMVWKYCEGWGENAALAFSHLSLCVGTLNGATVASGGNFESKPHDYAVTGWNFAPIVT